MKLIAQHGHQPGEKITRGMAERVIEGAVFSPRYLSPARARERLAELKAAKREAMVLLDPEYYASRQVGTPNNQLGCLEDWDYFTAQRRRDLVRGGGVEKALVSVYQAVRRLEVSDH